MPLLAYVLVVLLIGHAAAQSLDLTIPTVNIDSALAIASSATGQLSSRGHHI